MSATRKSSGIEVESAVASQGRKMSTTQLLTQQMRLSLADIGASGMHSSHHFSTEPRHARVERANSIEMLNQRKFEIQQKFMDTFIMKHSFFIGVGVFICAFSEDDFMRRFPEIINLWYIIFEVVSAYGNVGLSISEPGTAHSLVGSFGLIGKLTICAIMLLGKHRTQPKERDAVIDFKFKRLKHALNEIALEKREMARKNKALLAEMNPFQNKKHSKIVPLPASAMSTKDRGQRERGEERRISFSDKQDLAVVSDSSTLGIVRRE